MSSWNKLPTDHKDITYNGLKKYKQINNDDGTISLKDETVYTNKDASFFGAKEANQMNEALNYIMTKLENGTDLYSEFLEFFDNQKQLFLKNGESVISNITNKTNADYKDFEEHATNLKKNFDEFIANLKQLTGTSLSEIELKYKQQMSEYETQQKSLFDMWFNNIKSQLSGDIAGKLQTKIETLETKLNGFVPNDVVFSPDGKTITETSNNTKIVTEFVSEKIIKQQLFVNSILKLTKTTTFSDNGLNIMEVVE